LHRSRPGGSYTFQAILHPNGIVVYQYRSMTATLVEATVGIQNTARNDGLTVAHNTSYLHDGLAIMFAPPLQFMTLRPAAGLVPPGGAIELELAFHTFGLAPGVYRDNLEISSSVPGQPAVTVPVVLNAGLQADIAATPAELDFGEVRAGLSLGGTIEIRNSGIETLDLMGAEVTGDGFDLDSPGPAFPVGMGPGESIQLGVRFAPSDVCTPCAGVLVLHNNDPDESPLLVPLTGTGTPRRPGPRLRRPDSAGDVDPVSSLPASDLVRVPGQPGGRAGAQSNESADRMPGDYGLRLQGTSPQRASAQFELAIPVRSQVELSIFDTQGRFVAQVARRAFDPGWHLLEWSGSDRSGAPAPAGVYFARLVAGGRALHVRIALLR
jgi:flagellar hook capping protein FlgD